MYLSRSYGPALHLAVSPPLLVKTELEDKRVHHSVFVLSQKSPEIATMHTHKGLDLAWWDITQFVLRS
jgi:hypothetical protein